MLLGDDQEVPADPLQVVQQPDELGIAEIPPFQIPQQPLVAARCVNGNLVRPDHTEEEPPSTACRQSIVMAPGGVPLGRGPQRHQNSPSSLLRRRHIPPPPPPPPPPPAPVPHAPAAPSAATYPREWTPLNTRPKATGGGGPPNGPGGPGGSSGPGGNSQPGDGSNPVRRRSSRI